MAYREITLLGTILPSQCDGLFVLDVHASMGDAAEFGLAGLITFKQRECFAVETRAKGLPDLVRIPEHIARLKGELAGNVRKRKKR